MVFAKGDAAVLADCLASVLGSVPVDGIAQDARVQRHLQQHHPASVAAAYLQVLEHAHRAVAPLARTA